MLTFRDSFAIRTAPEKVPSSSEHLAWLVAEVTADSTSELDELLNILVVEPGDTLDDLARALGFDLTEEGVESVTRLPGWFELTYIVNGEGFGYVAYVPDVPEICNHLRAYCIGQLPRPGGE